MRVRVRERSCAAQRGWLFLRSKRHCEGMRVVGLTSWCGGCILCQSAAAPTKATTSADVVSSVQRLTAALNTLEAALTESGPYLTGVRAGSFHHGYRSHFPISFNSPPQCCGVCLCWRRLTSLWAT